LEFKTQLEKKLTWELMQVCWSCINEKDYTWNQEIDEAIGYLDSIGLAKYDSKTFKHKILFEQYKLKEKNFLI
tara:strand:+ start:3324 stop:3542 length:219 start_codon:yes stop_codon:yes gene_type:complete